jgi:hypothetical protein
MKDYEDKFLNVVQQNIKCHSVCARQNKPCEDKSCRLWIDYEEDLNCTEIAVQKNDKMILREIGDRLKLTPSRIKQIQNEAIKKITNRIIQITD